MEKRNDKEYYGLIMFVLTVTVGLLFFSMCLENHYKSHVRYLLNVLGVFFAGIFVGLIINREFD